MLLFSFPISFKERQKNVYSFTPFISLFFGVPLDCKASLAGRQLKEHQSLEHFPVYWQVPSIVAMTVRRCHHCLIQFSHLQVDNVFIGDEYIGDEQEKKKNLLCKVQLRERIDILT